MDMHRHTAPDAWIAQIFAAKAAMTGGVIRRNRQWVETEIGWDRFVTECDCVVFTCLRRGIN
jgi:hypothetical protein